VTPRPADDDAAEIAPFANPVVAERISAMVDADLAQPGARDVTAAHRDGSRLVRNEHGTYVLPTVVRCEADHPLANREFLFPFAAVVQVPAEALPEVLGPSLAVTAITEDRALVSRLLASPLLHRLNLGPLPTMRISWDQPHEGNLFEHLYARRAFQRVGAA
jgi:acyl-CoA reductase-like NAD-dependent aldehyde dehydrogenase